MDDEPTEHEPDPRMSLAAERTYLAYLRTGLALMAAGIGVAAALPHAGALGFRRALGVALLSIGAVVLGSARARWRRVDRAMRRGEPLPSAGVVANVSWLLVAVAVAGGVLVFLV